jgi:peptidoglycan/LPS O-acetylase OafA/YrhL
VSGTPSDSRPRALRLIVGRSLADCVEAGRDNILVLRLLAALMVVFGHSYVLVGQDAYLYEPMHWLFPRMYVHIAGVTIFFTISGFLITLSFLRRPELLRFLRARALRLWPALAIVVAVWSFVLGPMLSTMPVHDYFARGDEGGTVYRYFWTNVSLFRIWPSLPGVFVDNPVSHYVNGSLWTIPYEAMMYVGIAAAGTLRLFRFPWLASFVIAAVFSAIVMWPMYAGMPSLGGVPLLGLQLAGCFGAGSIACLLRRYVPVSTALMIVLVVAGVLARQTPFMWLGVLYFVFWFAYVPRLPSIPRQLDVSYGTYLWAFPVQQTIIHVAGVTRPLVLFAIATPIVLVVALASWLLVEKPALRLKNVRRRRVAVPEPA